MIATRVLPAGTVSTCLLFAYEAFGDHTYILRVAALPRQFNANQQLMVLSGICIELSW